MNARDLKYLIIATLVGALVNALITRWIDRAYPL